MWFQYDNDMCNIVTKKQEATVIGNRSRTHQFCLQWLGSQTFRAQVAQSTTASVFVKHGGCRDKNTSFGNLLNVVVLHQGDGIIVIK